MSTPLAIDDPNPDKVRPVASTLSTIILLLILAAVAYGTYVTAGRLRGTAPHSHVLEYIVTLAQEWLLFLFVVISMRRASTPLRDVIRGRWRSPENVLIDIMIAALFWALSAGVLASLQLAMRISARERLAQVGFLAPRGWGELALWCAVSLTAGFCEETVFRGYFQRQFTAFTKSAVAGMVLQGLVFGAAHIYQGFKTPFVIAVYGILFGLLAHFRKSLRPGMIAHAWQDTITGVALSFMAKYGKYQF
jgi:membrane protease YdiL (CAAX protease family)